MNHKILKRCFVAGILLCIACGIFFGIIRYSSDAIDNLIHRRSAVKIGAEKIVWNEYWDESDGIRTSASVDASFSVFFDAETEVYNLSFPVIADAPDTVTVVVTDAEGTQMIIAAGTSMRNNDCLLNVDRSAVSLKIVPGCEGFAVSSSAAVTANPRRFHVHYLGLLLSVLAAVLLLIVFDLLTDFDAIRKELNSMRRYRHLLLDLVSRDVKTKYRRSVLGLLWSVLNPLLMMLVLTAVFSTIFHYEAGEFSVYYLTGYLAFNFVIESTTFSMTSILGYAGLIKKVFIPKFIFPLEKCMFSLVNMLFSLIAAVIVFAIVGVRPTWTMLLFPIPILYLFVFNFGLGLILATLNTFFRDAGYLYNVFVTVWMYLTPIIYPVSILPAWLLPIVRLNPLFHYVQYFRNVTLYGTVPSLRDNLICIAFSLLMLMIGLLVFRKKQNSFIFYV